MAEEVRVDVRKKMRQATSISVALDESDGKKIYRARCDTPAHPYRFDCVLGISMKKLGTEGSVSSEVNRDHAQQGHMQLEAFHRRFFTKGAKVIRDPRKKAKHSPAHAQPSQPVATPRAQGQPVAALPGRCAATQSQAASSTAKGVKRKREVPQPTFDEDGFTDFRRKVRVVASDGGPSERRALLMTAASDFYPNAQLALTDMMHCIRRATQEPLHLMGEFEQVFEEIVNKRHALLPDIANSKKWQSILQAVQTAVLRRSLLEALT